MFEISRTGSDRVRKFSKSHGPGRVILIPSDPREEIRLVEALTSMLIGVSEVAPPFVLCNLFVCVFLSTPPPPFFYSSLYSERAFGVYG